MGINEVSNYQKRIDTYLSKNFRLHVAMSYVHIKHLFDKRIKHKVTELIADVKNSFFETLKSVDWMDRETKNRAIIKAEQMHTFIGYPEELLDDNNVKNYYRGVMQN